MLFVCFPGQSRYSAGRYRERSCASVAVAVEWSGCMTLPLAARISVFDSNEAVETCDANVRGDLNWC